MSNRLCPIASASPPSPCSRGGFTLIELLVVITIIGILAALSLAGIQGALKSAKKAEVRAMANQIKLGIEAYYAEYGYYPANSGSSDSDFLNTMIGAPNNTNNRRAIRFLEVPGKFTNSQGIVTPKNFYKTTNQFKIVMDTNFSGTITAPDNTSIRQAVAVGVQGTAPDDTNWIGTWK